MILVTGASGYLGRRVYDALLGQGMSVVSAGRSAADRYLDLRSDADWSLILSGVHTVIHCAGIAHNRASAGDYDCVNVEGTGRLAVAALRMGVRRFLYFSSLNVVPSDASDPRAPASEWPAPDTSYGASKRAAEIELTRQLGQSSCQLIILRPALVYDTELTGNLRALRELGQWLPFALPNSGFRSMVSRPDLVTIVIRMLSQELSGNGAPVVIALTDGRQYSAERIGRALVGRAQWRVPPFLWRLLLSVLCWLPWERCRSIRRSLSQSLWTSPTGQPQGGEMRWDLEALVAPQRKNRGQP